MYRLLTELDFVSGEEFSSQPSLLIAYHICVKHEGELATEDEMRRIRILGFLLLYAPKNSARVYLANSIISCRDDPAILVKLGQLFEQNVILPCEFCLGGSRSPHIHLCFVLCSQEI